MKTTFKKYQIKTNSELQGLLQNPDTLFVFDTCVLLDFLRCTDTTREELQNIFDECKNHLYMPYQIGKEFYKNRHNIVPDIDDQIRQLINKLKGATNDIKSRFSKGTYFLASLSDTVEQSIERLTSTIATKQKKFHAAIKENEICNFFETVFDGRVGKKNEFSESDMANFNQRIENGTPPGELDKENKDVPYGDYIIWLDIMAKAKKDHKNIIFVTSETKSDWFYKSKSEEIIAPRAELLEEFFNETGQEIHIYNIAKFVEDWHKLSKLDKAPTKVVAELKRMFRVKEMNNSETSVNKINLSYESTASVDETNVKV